MLAPGDQVTMVAVLLVTGLDALQWLTHFLPSLLSSTSWGFLVLPTSPTCHHMTHAYHSPARTGTALLPFCRAGVPGHVSHPAPQRGVLHGPVHPAAMYPDRFERIQPCQKQFVMQ